MSLRCTLGRQVYKSGQDSHVTLDIQLPLNMFWATDLLTTLSPNVVTLFHHISKLNGNYVVLDMKLHC